MAPPNQPPARTTYLILGAGVFGVSTALHLARKHRKKSHDNAGEGAAAVTITLLDRTPLDSSAKKPRPAASWDWNKAVRADYADPMYCGLALEAQGAWRGRGSGGATVAGGGVEHEGGRNDEDGEDSFWRDFYHETGLLWVSPDEAAMSRIVDNFRENFAPPSTTPSAPSPADKISLIPVDPTSPESESGSESARTLNGGIFEKAMYRNTKRALLNRGSGWADAKGALARATEEAVGRLGVRFEVAEAERLVFEDVDVELPGGDGGGKKRTKKCVGVRTADGREFRAERTVISTGAGTAELLDRSAAAVEAEAEAEGGEGSDEKMGDDLRVGDRLMAAAVAEGITRLDDETWERVKDMPVMVNEHPVERGGFPLFCPLLMAFLGHLFLPIHRHHN